MDEETDYPASETYGDGVYAVHLYCPCMDASGGRHQEKHWLRDEFTVIPPEELPALLGRHKGCPNWSD